MFILIFDGQMKVSKKVSILLLVAISIIGAIACKKKLSKEPEIAFYSWKMRSDENKYQNITPFGQFEPHSFYVKIMDIDWDDNYGYSPTASRELIDLSYDYLDSFFKSVDLIPCIFITNKTLEKTPDTLIKDLCNKIYHKTNLLTSKDLRFIESNLNLNNSIDNFKEIQIDCDWTASTRDKYFKLLNELEKLFTNKTITATLRLHQYNDQKLMGIPPVKEVYLMCYNTGNVKNWKEENSIFNYQKAKKYFKPDNEYPLKINFALPLFDWIVIFKNNEFYKIDNQFNNELLKDSQYVISLNTHEYRVVRDTVINNCFLRTGDKLKQEVVSDDDLIKAAELCKLAINREKFKVVFFDQQHLRNYKYETIKKAFDMFRN